MIKASLVIAPLLMQIMVTPTWASDLINCSAARDACFSNAHLCPNPSACDETCNDAMVACTLKAKD